MSVLITSHGRVSRRSDMKRDLIWVLKEVDGVPEVVEEAPEDTEEDV